MPNPRLPVPLRLVPGLCSIALLAAVAGCGPSGSGDTLTYGITFSLSATPAPLEALSFDVAYSGGGGFDGQTTAVQCRRQFGAAGATATFEDDDIDTLTVDLAAGDEPLDAVKPIVRCLFSADVQPTTANFDVTVTRARDENGNELKSQTQVLVTAIEEDNDGADTDHFLTFRVTSTHADVDSLSFDVDFLGDTGAFAVANQVADCTNLVSSGTLAAAVIEGQLRVAVISLDGFATPADIVRCRFIAVTAPTAEDFNVDVTGATTVAGSDIDPDVSISSITTGSEQ